MVNFVSLMETTKISHIAHLAEICVKQGITKVVISPGSRNAPLVIAFDSHPDIEIFTIHDERCAAFFALGMAEELKQPVMLTCTSGSAPVNYAPAVVEAYYRNVPLLLLTADRPVEMIDQGAGQTIRQKHLFHNFIKSDYELPNHPSSAEILVSNEIVNEACLQAKALPKGPVHINIPLAEPLYEIQNFKETPIIKTATDSVAELSEQDKVTIKNAWQNSEKKMVLIGQMHSGELNALHLVPLLNDPSVAILVENTSNIKDFTRICHCIDRTLAVISEDDLASFSPDLLITMGGAVVSKKIKAFLRKNKPTVNWRVGQFSIQEDTFQSVTDFFQVAPKKILRFLGSFETLPMSNFGSLWKQRDFLAQEAHEAYLSSVAFSDLAVFATIFDTIPNDINLHMSNSSVVRYCQLFNPLRGVSYYANRGVSGIDGSTSTAAGIACSTVGKLNVLITGDISFFYDSNGIWNSYLGKNFRIVLINNGGGGIFKIIEGPRESKQSRQFVAPYTASAKGICNAYGVSYSKVDSPDDLSIKLEKLFNNVTTDKPALLEVDTQDVENEKFLMTYFSQIATKS